MVDTEPVSNKGFFSCELSLQAGEQLFATATRVDVWLLLEYDGAWQGEAFEESDVPQSAKQHLAAQMAALPRPRLQLIKQARAADSPGSLAFFVAISRDSGSTLYRFALDDYEDLLKLDLPAIVAGEPVYQKYLSGERVFLVCTNGRRDKCCAKFGPPIYAEVVRAVGESAWQTTHIGGHRFSACAVFLPDGIIYGRIADSQKLAEEYQQGRIDLESYRGRSCYDEPVQAADYFLRRETNHLNVDQIRLIDVQPEGDAGWAVHFKDSSGVTHRVRVRREMSTFPIHKNSDDPARAPVPQYRFAEHEVV
jgi:hypothetical protein